MRSERAEEFLRRAVQGRDGRLDARHVARADDAGAFEVRDHRHHGRRGRAGVGVGLRALLWATGQPTHGPARPMPSIAMRDAAEPLECVARLRGGGDLLTDVVPLDGDTITPGAVRHSRHDDLAALAVSTAERLLSAARGQGHSRWSSSRCLRCAMRRCSVLIAATSARASRSACACACGSSPAAATCARRTRPRAADGRLQRRRPFPSQSRRRTATHRHVTPMRAPALSNSRAESVGGSSARRASTSSSRVAEARRRRVLQRASHAVARDAMEKSLSEDRSSVEVLPARERHSSVVAAVRASAPPWAPRLPDLRLSARQHELVRATRCPARSLRRRCRAGALLIARPATRSRSPGRLPASGARDPARDAARGRPPQVELRRRASSRTSGKPAPSAWSTWRRASRSRAAPMRLPRREGSRRRGSGFARRSPAAACLLEYSRGGRAPFLGRTPMPSVGSESILVSKRGPDRIRARLTRSSRPCLPAEMLTALMRAGLHLGVPGGDAHWRRRFGHQGGRSWRDGRAMLGGAVRDARRRHSTLRPVRRILEFRAPRLRGRLLSRMAPANPPSVSIWPR